MAKIFRRFLLTVFLFGVAIYFGFIFLSVHRVRATQEKIEMLSTLALKDAVMEQQNSVHLDPSSGDYTPELAMKYYCDKFDPSGTITLSDDYKNFLQALKGYSDAKVRDTAELLKSYNEAGVVFVPSDFSFSYVQLHPTQLSEANKDAVDITIKETGSTVRKYYDSDVASVVKKYLEVALAQMDTPLFDFKMDADGVPEVNVELVEPTTPVGSVLTRYRILGREDTEGVFGQMTVGDTMGDSYYDADVATVCYRVTVKVKYTIDFKLPLFHMVIPDQEIENYYATTYALIN